MKGIVSEVVITAIVIVSSIIVINNINTVLTSTKSTEMFNEARQNLRTVDAVINQLMFESTGARRSVDISLRQGKFIFSGEDDSIRVRLEGTGLLTPGTRIEEGNIIIQGGGTLDSYEKDIFDDGQTDLVMENSALLLAIKKLGNSTNSAALNTTNIITLIRNKRQDVNISYPRAGIFVNDLNGSFYGTWYTDLTQTGSRQQNSIVIYMNSSANITYDAVFTMSAATDFFELAVKNVKGV